MPREFHVLIIEDSLEEEQRFTQALSEMMPAEQQLRVHWYRSLEWGLRALSTTHDKIKLIICHDVQPAIEPTPEQTRKLIIVKSRERRISEPYRLMMCLNMLQISKPFLVGLMDQHVGLMDLPKPQDYHGPDGLLMHRHSTEGLAAIAETVIKITTTQATT